MKSQEYLALYNKFNEHIFDFLPTVEPHSKTLEEAMKYSLEAGGKRIRPVLILAACQFCGGQVKEALPYACAIEYIHTYSLIHDDLPAMDNDDLRRGKPTNHKVYGEAMAILAGDGLLNSAFEAMNRDMITYFDNPTKLKNAVKASYEIAKGAGVRGMVAGQVSDMEMENKQMSKEMLDYIHTNKTGALIIAAIRAGAHVGGATDEMLKDLTKYGECIGLSFQIADDLLDIYGDEKELGKKVGSDAQNNKQTYPSLYGIETCKAKVEELHETACNIMKKYGEKGQFFIDLAGDLVNRKN